MPESNRDDLPNPIHFEQGIPVFDPPPTVEELARQDDKNHDKSYKNEQIKIQRGMLRTQIALVFFGVVGAFVGVWQGRIAQTSGNAATVSANAAKKAAQIAQDTLIETRRSSQMQENMSTKASASSELASNKSLRATIDNFHQQERAWVVFKTVDIETFNPDQPLRLKLWFTNTGATPAFKVRYGLMSGLSVDAQTDEVTLERRIVEDAKNMTMWPKPIFSPQNEQGFYFEQDSPEIRARINASINGNAAFFVHGRIEYEDVSNTKRWMTFCVRLEYSRFEHKPDYFFCATHNDMSR